MIVLFYCALADEQKGPRRYGETVSGKEGEGVHFGVWPTIQKSRNIPALQHCKDSLLFNTWSKSWQYIELWFLCYSILQGINFLSCTVYVQSYDCKHKLSHTV